MAREGEHEGGEGTTIAEVPRSLALRSARSAPTIATQVTPLDALRFDEMRRSRIFGVTSVLLSVVIAVLVPLLDTTRALEIAVGATVAIVIVSHVWLIYVCGDPERFSPAKVAFVLFCGTGSVAVAVPFLGVFSPAPMILLLGIYFASLSQDGRVGLVVYLTCAVSQAVAGALITFGAIDDPGMIQVIDPSVERKLLALVLIQVVYGATFFFARSSARSSLRAVTEHDRAVRMIAQRDTLLAEARQDLEQALQIGGPGRFTGQKLGSFELGPIIGRGAMGEVYEARRASDGEPAAVKLLRPDALADTHHIRRFLREVDVAARLEVENVVQVLEVSDAAAPIPFLAMELLQGSDLAHLLRTERRLTPALVVELVEGVGRGIRAAAEAGIVHRDLKPQNIFCAESPDGRRTWKILDFGVSKLAESSGTLTSGRIVGTPVYMAPEQASGEDVDSRADLYSIAAIAYRCLTGHLPFRGREVAAVLYAVLEHMPARPSALVASLPRDFDLVLAIGLAKDRRRRFATSDEMAAAFAAALREELPQSLRACGLALEKELPWR